MSKEKGSYLHIHPWIKASWGKVLFLIVVAGFFLGYPGQHPYLFWSDAASSADRRLPFSMPTPAPYPKNVTGLYPGSEITAGGVVIEDVDSGVVLYERNSEVPFAPASTPRFLSALVALEAYALDDVLTVKTLMNDGATMKLVSGERITVENLLYGTLIQSGNDAVYTLAENYPGGVEAFVAAMNAKAKAIHLEHSSFTNPVGYDDPHHKMTPMDLVRLAKVALSDKTIVKMVAIPLITISDVTHTYFHPLTNVNQLLGKIPGVGGIKTGWTEEAGENLVTLIERGGHRAIVVVLKSQDRFGDTTKLIDWIFGNYSWEIIAPSTRE